MKKILSIVIVLATFTFACNKPNGFVISGKITNAEDKYLYLDELRVASSFPVDSVKLKKDGSFIFKGKIGNPNFYLLRLNEKNFITLLVDTTEKITVYGDAANFSRDYLVEGSPGSILVQELNNRLTKTKHKLDSIRGRVNAFRNRKDYSGAKVKWDQELADIKQSQINYSTDFILKHPFSMASVLALYQKFDDSNYVIQDLQSLKVAASALNSIFPKSEHVKALYANTQSLMAQEKSSRLQNFIAENGQNSPDIILPDINGRDVALSSLEGKVVLLQFWSAFNRDSRIQNEALVELYRKYKSKGLEIYQVSADTSRNAWLTAIEDDKLSWINVGDMKGSVNAFNQFNIHTIPSNYILDKDRSIVAKNLKGPALNQAIAKFTK
ncbi:MAG TPA: TlpA disulfide reductase family protein [Prolixibacteraceae bacterium]|nr:TlpA disulfide reductase family protein [Prolixibacteraceae bacterium]